MSQAAGPGATASMTSLASSQYYPQHTHHSQHIPQAQPLNSYQHAHTLMPGTQLQEDLSLQARTLMQQYNTMSEQQPPVTFSLGPEEQQRMPDTEVYKRKAKDRPAAILKDIAAANASSHECTPQTSPKMAHKQLPISQLARAEGNPIRPVNPLQKIQTTPANLQHLQHQPVNSPVVNHSFGHFSNTVPQLTMQPSQPQIMQNQSQLYGAQGGSQYMGNYMSNPGSIGYGLPLSPNIVTPNFGPTGIPAPIQGPIPGNPAPVSSMLQPPYLAMQPGYAAVGGYGTPLQRAPAMQQPMSNYIPSGIIGLPQNHR